MSLPKIQNWPVKSLPLPLSGIKLKYRPFLVKEEKLLLIAKESLEGEGQKGFTQSLDTIAAVIESCIVSGPVDVKELPTSDLEYLFLKIRCISKGETQIIPFRCKNPVQTKSHETAPCGTIVKHEIHLDKLEPVAGPGHSSKVEIPGTKFWLQFKYPTLNDGLRSVSKKMKVEEYLRSLARLVTSVIDSEAGTVYEEFTEDDMLEMIEGFTDEQFDHVRKTFVDSIPAISHTFEFECPNCQHKESKTLRGLDDLFS